MNKMIQEEVSNEPITYYFICRNIPKESFSFSINSKDLYKSVLWLCAKAKDIYQNKQNVYQIDMSIENVFDNLGYFNYQQELEEIDINRTFYFNASPRHEGLEIKYQYQRDQKNITQTIVLGKESRVSDLRKGIAKEIRLTEERIQINYQGKLLLDDAILLIDVGIKGDCNKNIVRVVQLIQIHLIPANSYDGYQKNFPQRQIIYLNPFQNIKQQIAEKQNVATKDFLLLTKQNQIVEQIEQIQDSDIMVIRDITQGNTELQLSLIDIEDINEPLLTKEFEESDFSISVKVYDDDTVDIIRKIAQLKHEIPYISCLAYLDMTQIKGKTVFKDLEFQHGDKQLYAVCSYQGEIMIVTRLKEVIPLKVDFKETVFGLKTILENKIGIDCLDQLMYFSGSLLEDNKKLTEYKICVGSRISVEENIFKESLKYKNRTENSNLEASKSNSINMLYRINQNANSKNNYQESEQCDMLGEGLNLVCTCTNQYCKKNYTDTEMIYVKGLGNHLIKLKSDGVLKTQNCKRCLSPVKLLSIVFKGCSMIFLEQTKTQRIYHFKWLFFSPLNIDEFKQYSPDSHTLYFYVKDTSLNTIEKNQSLLNCLICRNNQICSSNDLQEFIHEDCKSQFSLNVNEVFTSQSA